MTWFFGFHKFQLMYILNGLHIDKIYDSFWKFQNQVMFLMIKYWTMLCVTLKGCIDATQNFIDKNFSTCCGS
jgi:hypothetical protein